MTSNKKKVTIMSSTIGAIAIAAGTTLGILYNNQTELQYNISNVNEYVVEMKIEEPKEENIDLIELYCNDNFVDNTILPDGAFRSIPLVFTDLENLEIKCYSKGKEKGIASFNKDNKLIYRNTIGGNSK